MDSEFVSSLLKIIANHDFHDDLFWTEELKFYVNCNDLFHWGRSDLEPVLKEDLELLEKSLNDDCCTGSWLYCCRKRRMRPQGACYKHIEMSKWSLFNNCGPERELDLGNPQGPTTEKT